jgi:hypothetical protein
MSFQQMLNQHGGIVAAGNHQEDYANPHSHLCILELEAAYLVDNGCLKFITDNPNIVGRPDYRSINDASWSSRQLATPHLVQLHMAYEDWDNWEDHQKLAVTEQIVIGTLNHIATKLPSISPELKEALEKIKTVQDARKLLPLIRGTHLESWISNKGFLTSPSTEALWSSDLAAYVANANTDTDSILIEAIDIWINATK